MAEKFRPRQIADVIGQDNVKNMLRRSLRNKTFPQFSIMYGPSGTGKSTMAEICGLSITCTNPDNGEPCCQCKSCIDNLRMLDAGKHSYNLVKINMGAIERTDFKQTIKEVFTLSPAVGDSAVYIFEEIQALTKDEQNILLEYISNIAKNIYVIACTTEFMKLRQELRNRAIKFQFRQIKTDEAIQLIDRVCRTKGIVTPSSDIAKFLARSTGNCPREIVNLIDFLSDAESLNDKAMSEFLGYVHNTVYIEYFKKSKGDVYEFVQWLDSLQDTGYMNVLRGVRNFVVDCYGYVFGSNTAYFNTHEKHQIKELFGTYDEEHIMDVMRFFDECKFDDDTSAKYCLIAGRRFFLGKTTKDVVRESRHEANRATIQSENKTRHTEKTQQKATRITESGLDDLLSGMTRIKKTTVSIPVEEISAPVPSEDISLDVEAISAQDVIDDFDTDDDDDLDVVKAAMLDNLIDTATEE